MAPYGYSITKQTTWRGKLETFSNVYHYDFPGVLPSEQGFKDMLSAIKELELAFFDGDTTFLQGRCWGPTNAGAAASVTQTIMDLTGTGVVGGAKIPREMAIVAQFYLGRSSTTNRKRFLRKFWHVGGLADGVSGQQYLLGNTALPQPILNNFKGIFEGFKTITIGGNANDLCTPQGDHLPLLSQATVLPHLHVRQLHQ